MGNPDIGDRVQANHLVLCGHGIHYNPLNPGGKRFLYTGLPVEILIQDFRCRFIRVLGFHNGITALYKIRFGILCRSLEHTVNLPIVITAGSVNCLILKNQKEAPCQRFPVSNILNQPDIVLSKFTAL